MKRIAAVAVCALLGLLGGYFVAPVMSVWMVQSVEPELFAASIFYVLDSTSRCNCDGEPRSESLHTLTTNLSILHQWQKQDQKHIFKSELLQQEVGLTQAKLAQTERASGNLSGAEDHLRQAQQEFTQLGWKDVTPVHLYALTQQMATECVDPSPNKKTTAVSSSAPVTR
jgi:hypothetical protein